MIPLYGEQVLEYVILSRNGNCFFCLQLLLLLIIMEIKLLSYNCRGFNVSKVPFVKSLLDQCDLLLLQETWLYSSQFNVFNEYFPEWNTINVCGIDESVIQHGRPYGGCTIIYRSFTHVPEKIWFKSKRIWH